MDASRRAQGKTKLEVVREIVRYGGTVRMPIWALLAWFDYERRGRRVVDGIGGVLRECQLETRPDFEDLKVSNYATVEFRWVPRS